MTNKELIDLLQANAKKHLRPDNRSYQAILLQDSKAIAQKAGMDLATVERTALEQGIIPERYSRNLNSLTSDDQLRLLHSHVAIIGLGGLGGAVTEILARIGVGRLTLVDGDRFEESNLNRQLFSTTEVLDKSKVETACDRVRQINPAVDVRPVDSFFRAENSREILHETQLAIDCLDTIADRFVLEEACRQASIPLVSAAVGGSSGRATVIFPESPVLESLYGPADKSQKSGLESTAGTLPFAAVYMAAVECAEATTLLLGRPSELKDKLFLAEIGDHITVLCGLPGRDRVS